MTRRRAEERRVDEHAGDAALLYEQLEALGARRTLLEEQLGAGAAREARRGRISRELLDALQEPLTPGDSVENRARVLVLALEEGQPLLVLVVLHPAVRIAQRLAEIRVLHDVDARHRSGRNAHRRRGRRSSAPGEKGAAHAPGAHEQVTTVDALHVSSSWSLM